MRVTCRPPRFGQTARVLGIFMLGFRHGFDMDHVAAITDITGSQFLRLRAFLLSTIYALGHAAMVVALGLGIAWAGWEVPDAGRVIGVTLVVLGSYVLWCVATNRRPSSRAGLITGVMRRARDQLRPTVTVEHEHAHDHGDARRGHSHTHEDLADAAALGSRTSDGPDTGRARGLGGRPSGRLDRRARRVACTATPIATPTATTTCPLPTGCSAPCRSE